MSADNTDAARIRADGTVLGFDVGMRRIGVAVGNALTGNASAVAVVDVHAAGPDWGQVDRLLRDWRPDGLIVGDPMTLDGGDQPIRQAARAFAEALRHDCATRPGRHRSNKSCPDAANWREPPPVNGTNAS